MDDLQWRLDELMDIQIKHEVLDDRLDDLEVEWDDLEMAIARCRHEIAANEEAERDELRREYERSVL